ncbi:HAD-IA family hydrolase [Oceanobacillus sp. 143]|uniref:HAD family hydrolase n=1 Tax=Oceanobacillus zhaokaii TaxID=2052660 RepID=A0A345PJW4_9BACI|nr:HAD family hydrolase [Oceanobacillus zhaokaii]AXI10294.1 hypothetical protein CUC15_15740 [Oceanobacillus zhaokaii]QGS69348.1 HAD-IA family hydrolase [Oceanobacillus sp. 143]
MIKGILFDKDGTLIEFNSLWVESTYEMIHTLVKEYANTDYAQKCEEIANLIGLEGHQVREDSILASGTSEQMSATIATVLHADQQQVHQKINTFLYEETVRNSNNIKAIGDIRKLFEKLKQDNFTIGIVTADNYDITDYTLRYLGIREHVDFIGTASNYERKPNIEAMQAFCNACHLEKNEVIHVGDSVVDMEFSRHGRLGVGVLSGVGTEDTLRKYTPYIIENVHDLFDQNDKFIFEGK